jgi:2-methylcitrate dehydratase PrpD
VPRGHPKNPLSDAEMEQKFTSVSSRLASDRRALLDALWGLDKVEDVSALMKLIKVDVGE